MPASCCGGGGGSVPVGLGGPPDSWRLWRRRGRRGWHHRPRARLAPRGAATSSGTRPARRR
eukprot:scaffold1175_cov330-Prasinococcus_capsulatus_cf.AAC.4